MFCGPFTGVPEDICVQITPIFITTAHFFWKVPTLVSGAICQNCWIFYKQIDLPSHNTISEAREVGGTIPSDALKWAPSRSPIHLFYACWGALSLVCGWKKTYVYDWQQHLWTIPTRLLSYLLSLRIQRFRIPKCSRDPPGHQRDMSFSRCPKIVLRRTVELQVAQFLIIVGGGAPPYFAVI